MRKKEDINQLKEQFLALKNKLEAYFQTHPKQIIVAMFFILLVIVTGFITTKVINRKDYGSSLQHIYQQGQSPSLQKEEIVKNPSTRDALELLDAYQKVSSLDPDSMTVQDTALLKEVNNDLDKIFQ